MTIETLTAALIVITAASAGLVEALKPWLPENSKPIASIVAGVILAVLYIALPPVYGPLYLTVLSGAVATGAYAAAKRIGGSVTNVSPTIVTPGGTPQ